MFIRIRSADKTNERSRPRQNDRSGTRNRTPSRIIGGDENRSRADHLKLRQQRSKVGVFRDDANDGLRFTVLIREDERINDHRLVRIRNHRSSLKNSRNGDDLRSGILQQASVAIVDVLRRDVDVEDLDLAEDADAVTDRSDRPDDTRLRRVHRNGGVVPEDGHVAALEFGLERPDDVTGRDGGDAALDELLFDVFAEQAARGDAEVVEFVGVVLENTVAGGACEVVEGFRSKTRISHFDVFDIFIFFKDWKRKKTLEDLYSGKLN